MAAQKDIETDFQMIVSSASDLDMMLPKPPKADNEKLTIEEQQKMLAVFARYISEGHPGFAAVNAPNLTFPAEVKDKFKSEFVKLFLTSKEERTVAEIGKELFKFAKKYLPDNHFNVYTTSGIPIGMTLNKEEHTTFKKELDTYLQGPNIDSSQRGIIEHLYAERNQVGRNLFNDDEIAVLQQNGAEIISDKRGQTWRMTKINHQGQNIMLIGMSRFAAMGNDGNLNEDLIKDFTALAKEFSKQEYKDCGALIMDLRGNGGGWPYIGDYMARTLYGNTVSTEPKGHIKMDSLAAKLSYAYIEGKNPIERLRLKHETENTKYEQHDKSWAEDYPFNSELGFKKPILLLTDQNTGSNAEVTIGRLREHPYVRTIGDHSCGVVQYHPAATPKASIPLPYGLKIAVPPEGFTGPNGERLEGIGYKPDYPVEKGRDALIFGLENLDSIKQDTLQHLPQEKKVETQAKREAKVDETTSLNRKSIGKDKPTMLVAFNELVSITEVIPQLKQQNNKLCHHQFQNG